jgi:diketogulonate reductase-like aldo/keto reductase
VADNPAVATNGPGEVVLRDGARMPRIGLGVFQVPPEQTAAAVTAALAAGYRLIDTASAYRNEREVGEAVRASGLARGEVFVTTKCSNADQGYEEARRAFHESVERLDLGVVDLYLIHWPVPARDRFVETWRAFIELADEGLVRSIGVSNFRPQDLERIIAETGVSPVVNQIELHPRMQQTTLRALHARLGIVTEAWSSLARGTVLDDDAITHIASRLGRTPAQVIIRWHLQLGNVVLAKSVTPARIRENIDVLDFELSGEDLAAISRLEAGSRVGPDPDTFFQPSQPH